MRAFLRQAVPWLVGAVLIALAAVAVAVTPGDAQTERPFRSELVPHELVSSRTLAATLLDVRLSEGATANGWSAEGLWLIVDLEIEATTEPVHLRYALLERETGQEYRASERPASLLDAALDPGLPLRGSLAFELPASARDTRVRIDLGHMIADTRADGLLSLSLDLGTIELERDAGLHVAEWAR